MKIVKRRDGYWITDLGMAPDCGPYTGPDGKADAESDMRGMERFWKHADEPGFVTCETATCKKAKL